MIFNFFFIILFFFRTCDKKFIFLFIFFLTYIIFKVLNPVYLFTSNIPHLIFFSSIIFHVSLIKIWKHFLFFTFWWKNWAIVFLRWSIDLKIWANIDSLYSSSTPYILRKYIISALTRLLKPLTSSNDWYTAGVLSSTLTWLHPSKTFNKFNFQRTQ